MKSLHSRDYRAWLLWLLPLVLVLTCPAALGNAALPVLKLGAEGSSVWDLQLGLYQLGYLQIAPAGLFDKVTLEAVKGFQRGRGLSVDGVVGEATWRSLQQATAGATIEYTVRSGDTLWSLARKHGISVEVLAAANRLRDADRLAVGQKLVIPMLTEMPATVSTQTPDLEEAARARDALARLVPQALKWSEVQKLFPHSTVARIVDVRTGTSFRVRRYYGHLHADVEPLTAEDAAVMKSVYGGQWSWSRRPIVVEVGGKRIAASMNGYPHGGSSISGNEFAGHFCIHFSGSSIHRTGKPDPDHEAAIQEAVRAFSGTVAKIQ